MTDFVCTLHCRPDPVGRKPWTVAAPLCWWRSSLWLMFACCSRRALSVDFRLRRWHGGLGKVEQADAKPGQIRGHLVYNKSASASTTNRCDTDCWHANNSSAVRRWSWLDADWSMRAHVKRTVCSASQLSANCTKSAEWCRQPRSRSS